MITVDMAPLMMKAEMDLLCARSVTCQTQNLYIIIHLGSNKDRKHIQKLADSTGVKLKHRTFQTVRGCANHLGHPYWACRAL